ncbi:N-acetylmuramoyl-L-alanine amidase [Bacillaceae bacterium Marseille-Q3522]|nr:N-acetylmuramoyl-L-alanine amidase [Bacillaceae bacterium Marseille-Q3522]
MVRIFIDPGHGGSDPGAVANGLQEKDLTLRISKRIRDMLGEYSDAQVKLSREGDQTLSLSQRTHMANAWGADYLISVHINAGGGTGFESFVYTGVGGATVAYQNVIHVEITRQVDFRDRGKKQANLHMVRESHMPALLTENGFIDRASDARKLKDNSYLDRIARGHVIGLEKAFGLKKKAAPAPQPKPSQPAPGGNITVGSIVTIQPHATNYMTNQRIPDWVKSRQFKVIQEKDFVRSRSRKAYLLDGIRSWVLEQDLAPVRSGDNRYTVQAGDTLYGIARKFNVSVNQLVSWNGISNPSLIHPGQKLRVK